MDQEEELTNEKVQEQICILLNRYLTHLFQYEKVKAEISSKSESRVSKFLEKHGTGNHLVIPEGSQIIHSIDEFVDHLVTYYSYYRNQRRSLHTLFSSVGITETKEFDETVRSISNPREAIKSKELGVSGIKWFLGQFYEDQLISEKFQHTLITYLPHLEKIHKMIQSEFMYGFLEVLRYITSEKSTQLQSEARNAINAAMEEEGLEEVINYVAEAISLLAKDSREFPTFILTESPGLFGIAEMEEFDRKIQEFQKLRQKFKEHVSLHDRTHWIFEEHHNLLFRSLLNLTHIEMMELMHKIQGGLDIRTLASHFRDHKAMLLGASQATSLFLEFSAYKDQMIELVESYKEIAKFLKSELLEIIYQTEVQRNELFLKMRKGFKDVLTQFQETLLQTSSASLEDSETQDPVV